MFELLLLITLLALFGWSAWIDTVWIAAVALVLYLAGNWLFGDLSHLSFLADPITFVSIVVFSLAVGAVWSLWKWRRWMLSTHVQDQLRAGKNDHDERDSDTPYKASNSFPNCAKPSQNVERIVTWVMLWPFSMIVYFFADFLMDIGRWVYERLGKIYARITDAALPEDMK